MRFGLLDLDVLGEAIQADLASVAGMGLRPTPRLAVTCLDQFEGMDIAWVEQGRTEAGRAEALVRRLSALVPDAAPPLQSYGPSRTTLHSAVAWSD